MHFVLQIICYTIVALDILNVSVTSTVIKAGISDKKNFLEYLTKEVHQITHHGQRVEYNIFNNFQFFYKKFQIEYWATGKADNVVFKIQSNDFISVRNNNNNFSHYLPFIIEGLKFNEKMPFQNLYSVVNVDIEFNGYFLLEDDKTPVFNHFDDFSIKLNYDEQGLKKKNNPKKDFRGANGDIPSLENDVPKDDGASEKKFFSWSKRDSPSNSPTLEKKNRNFIDTHNHSANNKIKSASPSDVPKLQKYKPVDNDGLNNCSKQTKNNFSNYSETSSPLSGLTSTANSDNSPLHSQLLKKTTATDFSGNSYSDYNNYKLPSSQNPSSNSNNANNNYDSKQLQTKKTKEVKTIKPEKYLDMRERYISTITNTNQSNLIINFASQNNSIIENLSDELQNVIIDTTKRILHGNSFRWNSKELQEKVIHSFRKAITAVVEVFNISLVNTAMEDDSLKLEIEGLRNVQDVRTFYSAKYEKVLIYFKFPELKIQFQRKGDKPLALNYTTSETVIAGYKFGDQVLGSLNFVEIAYAINDRFEKSLNIKNLLEASENETRNLLHVYIENLLKKYFGQILKNKTIKNKNYIKSFLQSILRNIEVTDIQPQKEQSKDESNVADNSILDSIRLSAYGSVAVVNITKNQRDRDRVSYKAEIKFLQGIERKTVKTINMNNNNARSKPQIFIDRLDLSFEVEIVLFKRCVVEVNQKKMLDPVFQVLIDKVLQPVREKIDQQNILQRFVISSIAKCNERHQNNCPVQYLEQQGFSELTKDGLEVQLFYVFDAIKNIFFLSATQFVQTPRIEFTATFAFNEQKKVFMKNPSSFVLRDDIMQVNQSPTEIQYITDCIIKDATVNIHKIFNENL